MSRKKVIIMLLCILFVLAAGCYFMSIKMNSEIREEIAVAFDEKAVSQINVKAEEGRFSWTKSGDLWTAEGFELDLNQEAVKKYMSEILCIKGRLIDSECYAFEDYGLDVPIAELEYVLDSGKLKRLMLGSLTPAQTEYYMCDEENNLYVIYTSSGNEMKKGIMELADTLICSIPYESVVKIEVSGKSSFTLDNNGTSQWSVIKDDSSRSVDELEVKTKVTKSFNKMYAINIITKTEENLKKYSNEDIEVSFYLADGSERVFDVIGKTADRYFFTLDNGDYIYEVTKSYFEFTQGESF